MIKYILTLLLLISPLTTYAAHHVYTCSQITAGGVNNASCSGTDLQFSAAGINTAQTVTPDPYFTYVAGNTYYFKLNSTGTAGKYYIDLSSIGDNFTGAYDANSTNVEKTVVAPSGSITTAAGFGFAFGDPNTDALITSLCVSDTLGECPNIVPPVPPDILAQMLSNASSSMEMTTGFNIQGVVHWAGDNLVKLFVGSGLAILRGLS